MFRIDTGKGGVSNHPYKISIRENPDIAGSYQAKVYTDSYLFSDIDPDNLITITNLDTWFALLSSGTDKIWEVGTFIDGSSVNRWPTIQAAEIESLGQSDIWGGGVVEHNGENPPDQTKVRRVIATINCDVTPPVVAIQHVRSHLTTELSCAPGSDSSGNETAQIACVIFTQI